MTEDWERKAAAVDAIAQSEGHVIDADHENVAIWNGDNQIKIYSMDLELVGENIVHTSEFVRSLSPDEAYEKMEEQLKLLRGRERNQNIH